MSLSEMKPKARNTTTMGISVRMYGMLHRIWWPSMDPRLPAPYMRRYMVDVGRAPCGTCDRVSHTHSYLLGCCFLNTYTWLLDMRSCAIITFSLPLMTKYPPWSNTHSPILVKSRSDRPFKLQWLLRSIMGMYASRIREMSLLLTGSSSGLYLRFSSSWYCRVSMSTYTGDWYVNDRNRASCGYNGLTFPSASNTAGGVT